MLEKIPKGVTLKSFAMGLYPVLVAVTVRTHAVIPLKERVLDVLFQVQSPDFFAMA